MFFVGIFFLEELNEKVKQNEEYEFFVFFEEIQRELYLANSVNVSTASFTLHLPTRSISYSKYNDYVRRRVNGTGHELVLQNVSSFDVMEVNGGLVCQVMFSNGKKVSKEWFTIHELEKNSL